MAEPCRCALCLALLELAASAERGRQARRDQSTLRIVEQPKRRTAA